MLDIAISILWLLIGIIILALGICLSLALLTYHPDDSSAFYTSTNTAVIWWSLSPTAWRLQARTNLVATGGVWTDCSYQTNGATCYRLEYPPGGHRFYRLHWP